jgi:predicted CopG family antitoxin
MKVIKVNDEVWKKLSLLKVNNQKRSLNEVLVNLLEGVN